MAQDTVPYFVVGSGRSGTRTIYKMLSGIPTVEAHHEFVCTQVQQVAALHFMGLLSKDEVKCRMRDLHGAGIFYSTAPIWVDCSNKLSWILEPLYEMFPKMRVVHLVRDGRKVASSYFHKLTDEMYDDASVAILRRWLADRSLPMPPPEKKYWWNMPQPGQPFADVFPTFDQFQRACYQWTEANRVILESLERIPRPQQLFVKLEELVSRRDEVRRLLDFFGLPYEEHFFEFLQTPQNVIFPMDFRLTPQQADQFSAICGPMMQRLGYPGQDEYAVNYGAKPP